MSRAQNCAVGPEGTSPVATKSPGVSPILVQRLAFAKYLLAAGVEKTMQPEPLAAAGLLSLHDAVEFANEVAVEHLNAKKTDDSFLAYWDVLDAKLAPSVLPERATMKRLSKARVALKHHGTMPSRLDLDSFVETTQRFFAETFPLVFGLDLHSVSMIEFVSAPTARDRLRLAQDHLERGSLKDGFTEACGAFSELLADFEKNTEDDMGRPLIGPTTRWNRSYNLRHEIDAITGGGGINGPSELGRFVDAVTRTLDDLNDNMKLVAFGIDLRRLARFRRLTPHVTRSGGDRLSFTWGRDASTRVADLEFCIQFVLESALRIQEF